MEGGGSGRGTNIYAYWRLRVTGSNPAVHVRFLLLAFDALGRKSQRAQKGELCAAALAEVASLGVGRGLLIFPIFFDACYAVYNARRLLGSKTRISATLHRQGPRSVSDEAINACFGITGTRNRPLPTLLPSETCTQTPLGRLKMPFHRDPDFADAPETTQNGGFRHHFATACVFADFRPSTRRHRPKASFARKYWLCNVAALACC